MELLLPHLSSRGRREETGVCQTDGWTGGQVKSDYRDKEASKFKLMKMFKCVKRLD